MTQVDFKRAEIRAGLALKALDLERVLNQIPRTPDGNRLMADPFRQRIAKFLVDVAHVLEDDSLDIELRAEGPLSANDRPRRPA